MSSLIIPILEEAVAITPRTKKDLGVELRLMLMVTECKVEDEYFGFHLRQSDDTPHSSSPHHFITKQGYKYI
jgi:hypothetical protein